AAKGGTHTAQRRFFFRGRGGWLNPVAGAEAPTGGGVMAARSCDCSVVAANVVPAVVAIAGAGAGTRPLVASTVRTAARCLTARHFGSRSFSMARIGVATKIDEYDPVMRPTSSATAKSCRATA